MTFAQTFIKNLMLKNVYHNNFSRHDLHSKVFSVLSLNHLFSLILYIIKTEHLIAYQKLSGLLLNELNFIFNFIMI